MPSRFEPLEAGDLLVVRADSEALEALTSEAGLELGAEEDEDAWGSEALEADEMSVTEAVIMPRSPLINRTAAQLNLRWRYGLNLLAGARQGARLQSRLSEIRFQAGDALLLKGESGRLQEALADLGCLPLAERELRLG